MGGEKIVTEAQQAFSFTRRAMFLGGFQLGIGTLLAARMGWLAIAQNEKYTLLAESNRVNLTLQLPRRGWIVDRKGLPLALNRTAFRVDIIPDQLQDPDGVLSKLTQIMNLSDVEVLRIKADIKKSAGFQPVQVAENLDWDRFAAVSVRATELQGVAPSEFYTRAYPDGPSAGHLVGYVGSASARDYEKTKDPLLITPGFKIGKEALEKTLEDKLRGEPGAKRTEVTARGKLVRELATRPDVPGKTVHLTIDAGLQAYAGRRIGIESGAAVVIDCKTGGILALTSMPCFDPNGFSDGIGRQEWKMLQEDEYKPLLNKAMQGLYPPGSTVKPAAALALLALGIDPKETVSCSGGYTLGSRRFRCLGRHGPMNMEHAIMKSCNTYFYAMGHRVGYDKIAPVARMLGLGQEFDLPMPSQYYGTVPDSQWLKKKFDRDWGAFDSLNATIGQGYVLTTPLQLAVLAARVASGRSLEPSLIKGTEKPGKPLPFTPEQLAVVRNGMDLVVNGSGTAVRSRLDVPGVRMAGKTGTAQVRGLPTKGKAKASARKYRDHGLFVFFAPADAPLYAGAVVIEHGMGGARAAAPVAKDLMTYLFEPDKAMERLEALEAGWGGDPATRLKKKMAAWNAVHDPEAAAAAAEGTVEDSELEKQKAEEDKKEKQTPPASREASVDAEAADSDTPDTPVSRPPAGEPPATATPPAPSAAAPAGPQNP
ncbi:MAG TPA: penicillin-binding protein 2 [Chakrabartia sp.]|nr:penicillin-binding protein 2 [Chakrabartia sp.]